MLTANLVAGALLVSLIGSFVAVAIRHYTSQNWVPHIEDVWYFILSGSVSVTLVLLGFNTPEILAASTGINTPLALIKTGIDKYAVRNGNVRLSDASLEQIQARLTKMEAQVKKG